MDNKKVLRSTGRLLLVLKP